MKAEPKELEHIVEEYSGNPIITKEDVPYSCEAVFNTAATKFNGKYLLLPRIEDRSGISHFGKAISEDGFNFTISDDYAFSPSEHEICDNKGVEDPRITKIGDMYYVTYVAYSKYGAGVGIAETKNFKRFKRLGIVLSPEDKDATLLPEKINGKYVMYHRPTRSRDIFISYSPNLKHWGEHHPVMERGKAGRTWDEEMIGACATPFKTEEGWLLIYHGVIGSTYRLGCALFDLKNPAKLRGRSKIYILGPKGGSGIIFSCGAIPEDDGTVKIYYSINNNTINVGIAKIDDLINICKL